MYLAMSFFIHGLEIFIILCCLRHMLTILSFSYLLYIRTMDCKSSTHLPNLHILVCTLHIGLPKYENKQISAMQHTYEMNIQ